MEVNSVSQTGYNQTQVAQKRSIVKPNNYSLKADTVSFAGKKKTDAAEAAPKKSSFVHKALIACVGAPYPGLGQAINGQWGKAAMFAIGTPVAAVAALMVNPTLVPVVAAVAYTSAFVDTYRNA